MMYTHIYIYISLLVAVGGFPRTPQWFGGNHLRGCFWSVGRKDTSCFARTWIQTHQLPLLDSPGVAPASFDKPYPCRMTLLTSFLQGAPNRLTPKTPVDSLPIEPARSRCHLGVILRLPSPKYTLPNQEKNHNSSKI